MYSQSAYDFGPAGQSKLLAMLIREPRAVYHFVEPHLFSNPVHCDVARIVKSVLKDKDLESDRLSKTLLNALVRKNLMEQRRVDNLPAYKRVVASIFEARLDVSDKNFWREMALALAKEQAFRNALIQAREWSTFGTMRGQ